jgi:ribonucleoside-diphosphate reductase alpha chain
MARSDSGLADPDGVTMTDGDFDNELSALVWTTKYRYSTPGSKADESSVRDTWQRVAAAVASVEAAQSAAWKERFLEILDGFRFLPAGRILASAGTSYDATLFNCFVMGPIDDSIAGIFERLRESAVTMQRGGGIGCDFSTLRPAGSRAATSGRTASGPVSFMRLWNAMCATLLSKGNRRGAMMGVLRCDHPDIFEFIEAKRTSGALTNFNLSVQVTNAFLQAVSDHATLPLIFPADDLDETRAARIVQWPGSVEPVPCAVHAEVPAADLWERITAAAYESAEPGVLFIDRINELNNLYYREHITATNPCGEVPLPPFGACNLGSINLTAFIQRPFSPRAKLDLEAVGRVARDAVRFLDNVVDLSPFPLQAQAAEARATRRIGLGLSGLADALIMLGHRYDSAAGRELARTVAVRIRDEAYLTSIELAREKGAFPYFDKDAYLDGKYIGALPDSIRDGIARHGIRNSHLLAIAPAGSISILANNISSGIEPVFAPRMERVVLDPDGRAVSHQALDHAYSVWRLVAGRNEALPSAFVTAQDISASDHLLMAAALQPLVDNSISKTINVAEETALEDFRDIYKQAFDLGLKGCTVFRSNPVTGAILSRAREPETIHCCVPEREGD